MKSPHMLGLQALRLLLFITLLAYTALPLLCGVWHEAMPNHAYLRVGQTTVASFHSAHPHSDADGTTGSCLTCLSRAPGVTLARAFTPASAFQTVSFFASVSLRYDSPRPAGLSVSVPALRLVHALMTLPLLDPPPKLAL